MFFSETETHCQARLEKARGGQREFLKRIQLTPRAGHSSNLIEH
jgi:hypothetical protein